MLLLQSWENTSHSIGGVYSTIQNISKDKRNLIEWTGCVRDEPWYSEIKYYLKQFVDDLKELKDGVSGNGKQTVKAALVGHQVFFDGVKQMRKKAVELDVSKEHLVPYTMFSDETSANISSQYDCLDTWLLTSVACVIFVTSF